MTEQFRPIEIMIEKINYLYSQMSKDGEANKHIELSLLKKYSSELYDNVIDLELAVSNGKDNAADIESQIAKAIDQEADVNQETQVPETGNSVEDVVQLEFAAEGKRIMRRLKRINKLNGDVIEVHQDDAIEEGSMAEYEKPLNKYLASSLTAGATAIGLPAEVEPAADLEAPVEIEELEVVEAAEIAEVHEEVALETTEPEEELIEATSEVEETIDEPVTIEEEKIIEELVEEPVSIEEESKIEEIEIVEALTVNEIPEEAESIEVVEAVEEIQAEESLEVEEATIAEASAPVEASSEIESVKDSDWVKAAEEEEKVNKEAKESIEASSETTEAAEENGTEKLTVLEEIFGKSFFAASAAGGAAAIVNSGDTDTIEQTDVAEGAVDEVEQALENAIEAEVSSPTEILEINEELIQEPATLAEVSEVSNETEQIISESAAKAEAPVEVLETVVEPEPSEEIVQTPAATDFFDINNNQKIHFVKELFGNDQVAYEGTLSEMSQCKNVIEAYTYINLHIKAKYKWDSENETVREFQKIVKDKFLG